MANPYLESERIKEVMKWLDGWLDEKASISKPRTRAYETAIAALELVQKLRELHRRVLRPASMALRPGNEHMCDECTATWPCATIALIEGSGHE